MSAKVPEKRREKGLVELSEAELLDALSHHVQRGTVFSYNDILHEFERRQLKERADRTFKLSILAICVSVLSLLASIVVAVFK